MDVNTFTERIGTLIGQDDLKTAIAEMSHLLKESKRLDEVIMQSARYSDLMSQIRMGTIDFKNANLSKNQIRFGLLDLLREVETSAANDPAILEEIQAVKMTEGQINIQQTHTGSGDNVGGDKIINS